MNVSTVSAPDCLSVFIVPSRSVTFNKIYCQLFLSLCGTCLSLIYTFSVLYLSQAFIRAIDQDAI